MNRPYHSIVQHYEACLERHGDSHLGVDWPDADDAQTRYGVMLDVARRRDAATPCTLLDLGCGTSHLLEHIRDEGIDGITYSGLDLSPRFVDVARTKFPGVDYWCLDVLTADVAMLPRFDYVVMNGVFTEKRELAYEAMLDYAMAMIAQAFALADVGIAFNVMSKHVDWERDDLFHLPFDTLAAFLTREVSREFVFRNDYGLYEYTAYVYR